MAGVNKPQNVPPDAARAGVSIKTLCYLLDCSERAVRFLEEKRLVVKIDRNKYLLGPTVRNVVNHYRQIAAGRAGRDDEVDIIQKNAALKDVQRQIQETRLLQLRGELIARATIEEAWKEILLGVRQLFLAVPARACFDLPHLTAKDREVLDRLVRDMLIEAALGNEVKIPAKAGAEAGMEGDVQG